MVYALNVFNLLPGRENESRDYSVKAGKRIYGMGGRVVVAGREPRRSQHGDMERRYVIVVEFPGEAVIQAAFDEAQRQDIHHLRENACTDCIWTLHEPCDMRAWVNQGQA